MDVSQQVEETVQSLADLHERQHQATGPFQRFANRATRLLGQPGSVAAVLALVILWMVGNYLAADIGASALERFPFPDLSFFATVAAFLIALLVLSTQRHGDELATRRAQLTLQIAILNDRKLSKIIALIEEQRRDSTALQSRADPEAEEMAIPVDPIASLELIEATHFEE